MDQEVASSREGGIAATVLRQYWLGVLARASVVELEAAWAALADKPRYRTLRQSETGLVQTPIR